MPSHLPFWYQSHIYPEQVDREPRIAEILKIAAGMQRGDELTHIPITSNARSDMPWRFVALAAPICTNAMQ